MNVIDKILKRSVSFLGDRAARIAMAEQNQDAGRVHHRGKLAAASFLSAVVGLVVNLTTPLAQRFPVLAKAARVHERRVLQYPGHDTVPLDGVLAKSWRPLVDDRTPGTRPPRSGYVTHQGSRQWIPQPVGPRKARRSQGLKPRARIAESKHAKRHTACQHFIQHIHL
jgi:hypothetical protein